MPTLQIYLCTTLWVILYSATPLAQLTQFKSYNTNPDDGREQHYTDINTNIQVLKRVH